MKISEKIRILRKQRGMSQEDLASALYVSRQSVSRWELDECQPDLDCIVQLSDIFGVTTDYLLKEEELAKSRQNTATVGGHAVGDVAAAADDFSEIEKFNMQGKLISLFRKRNQKIQGGYVLGLVASIIVGVALTRIFSETGSLTWNIWIGPATVAFSMLINIVVETLYSFHIISKVEGNDFQLFKVECRKLEPLWSSILVENSGAFSENLTKPTKRLWVVGRYKSVRVGEEVGVVKVGKQVFAVALEELLVEVALQ